MILSVGCISVLSLETVDIAILCLNPLIFFGGLYRPAKKSSSKVLRSIGASSSIPDSELVYGEVQVKLIKGNGSLFMVIGRVVLRRGIGWRRSDALLIWWRAEE